MVPWRGKKVWQRLRERSFAVLLHRRSAHDAWPNPDAVGHRTRRGRCWPAARRGCGTCACPRQIDGVW